MTTKTINRPKIAIELLSPHKIAQLAKFYPEFLREVGPERCPHCGHNRCYREYGVLKCLNCFMEIKE